MSLPAYPFAKDRYWIEAASAKPVAADKVVTTREIEYEIYSQEGTGDGARPRARGVESRTGAGQRWIWSSSKDGWIGASWSQADVYAAFTRRWDFTTVRRIKA